MTYRCKWLVCFQLPDSYWIVKQCEFMYMTTKRHFWHFRQATKHYLFALWCSWPSGLIFLFNFILLTSTLVRVIQIIIFFFTFLRFCVSQCASSFINILTLEQTTAQHASVAWLPCSCRLPQKQAYQWEAHTVLSTGAGVHLCWSKFSVFTSAQWAFLIDRLHGHV